MHFDRKKFFDGIRRFLEAKDLELTQDRVDALEFLVTAFESTPTWRSIPEIAYALATIAHETAWTFKPIKEYRAKPGSKGRANQDRYWLSGYYGRGYVQLTWKKNYAKFGLADHPELALDPPKAFGILTVGMHEGIFTGKKLSDYISDTGKDYKNARKIINGLDQADKIAGHARDFETILRNSRTNSTAPAVDQTTSGDLPADNPATDSAPEPSTLPPASIVPITSQVVEVEQVKAAEQPKEDVLTKVQNRFLAIPAAILSAIAAAVTWATSAPLKLVIALVGTAGGIILIYIIVNATRNYLKEKLENTLIREREQRAHEIQMATLKSAMDPMLQTVRVVPQPIQNSEPAPETAT